MGENFPALFEAGVANYFRDFAHRQARESPQQAWLLMSIAQLISPQLVVAELTVPNQDLVGFSGMSASSGALNYDFAVTRSEIDLRTWKSRTPGWQSGVSTVAQTIATLREVAVLAEFKIAESKSTSTRSLARDLDKLQAATRFLAQHGYHDGPATYLVVLDPDRKLDVEQAIAAAQRDPTTAAPLPKILLGP